MKKGIHPQYYKNAKVFVGGEEVTVIGSTKPEIYTDIWSQTHPFWTGQQRIVDTEKLADKFQRRAEQQKDEKVLKAKKEKIIERAKKAVEANQSKKLTLRDMMKSSSK